MNLKPKNLRILFVCLGNICRSPAAEGVFRTLLERGGLDGRIEVDSAGTGAWHVGEPPDRRMRQTASRRGYSLESLRARRLEAGDLESFDLILAMDRQNLSDIRRLDTAGLHTAKIRLFRDFDPNEDGRDVPDPYWSGEDGFEDVLTMVERTAAALIDHLSSTLSTE